MGVRIIKFRAYIGGKMYEFDFNNVENDELDTYVAGQKIYSDTPIMQWTGLCDKNGVEIYDGDIVVTNEYPFYDTGVPGYRAVVEWAGVGFAYTLYCVNPNKGGISHGICQSMDEDIDWEVIGNIHENPELVR